MNENTWVVLICGFFVAFYAASRYNTPESNRRSTTRILFWTTGAGYVLTSVLLYLVLCRVVLEPGMLSFLGVDDAQKTVAKYAAPPILAALVLTTLLPQVIMVKDCDAWLLKQFQVWGRIPFGVRHLADKLAVASLPVSNNDLVRMRAWITQEADIPSELSKWLTPDSLNVAHNRFTRLFKQYLWIAELNSDPKYLRELKSRNTDWKEIDVNFRVFMVQSEAFFVLFEHLSRVSGGEEAGELAQKQARVRYRDVCNSVQANLVEFIAQVMLSVEGTDHGIAQRLAELGCTGEDLFYPPMPIGPLLFTGFILMVFMLASLAFTNQQSTGHIPAPLVVLQIAISQTIAMLVAVLPKLRSPAFRRGAGDDLPYMAWLFAALLAGVLAFTVERGNIAFLERSTAAALDFANYPLRPLAPAAVMSALAVSILCDVELPIVRQWLRRTVEGSLCGLALVFTIVVCLKLLAFEPATSNFAPIWFPFFFSFCIGFCIGSTAPHLYRVASHVKDASDADRRRVDALLAAQPA
jgi:hypothetical protein